MLASKRSDKKAAVLLGGILSIILPVSTALVADGSAIHLARATINKDNSSWIGWLRALARMPNKH